MAKTVEEVADAMYTMVKDAQGMKKLKEWIKIILPL